MDVYGPRDRLKPEFQANPAQLNSNLLVINDHNLTVETKMKPEAAL